MKHTLISGLFIAAFSILLNAENSNTTTLELYSTETKAEYQITLLHPASENTSSTLHIYLDVNNDSKLLKDEIEKISAHQKNSPVTAIIHLYKQNELQRTKDLTGDAKQGIAGSGNAHLFYQFIKESLIPEIESITGNKFTEQTLHTNSMSAAFGFYALFVKPGLFDTYLFDSPDMEWHQTYPFRAEYIYYKTMNPQLDAKVYFVAYETDTKPSSISIIHQLRSLLSYRGYKKLDMHFKVQESPEDKTNSREEALTKVLARLYKAD